MRRVVSDSEVCHLFANKVQDEARTPRGNLYFEGDTIYSYGSHFPIATHYNNNIVLFTTNTYSVTTSKHIGLVKGACSHKTIVYCNDPDNASRGYHTRNLEDFKSQIQNNLSGLDKARKPEKYIESAKYNYNQCKIYCDLFKIKIPKELTKIIKDVDTGKYKLYLQKEAKRLKREAELKYKKSLKELEVRVQMFKDFKVKAIYTDFNLLDKNRVWLRYNKETKNIETSKGIKVPKDIAIRIYNKFLNKEYKLGDKVLEYSIVEIEEDYFRIGCTKIYFKECEDLLKEIN